MAVSPIQAAHIKNLQWAIWFCQVDLNSFREGDWVNVKEDLFSFTADEREIALLTSVFPGKDHRSGLKNAFCDQVKEADIVEVQPILRSRLRGFAFKLGEDPAVLLRKLRHPAVFVGPVFESVQRLQVTEGVIEVQGFRPDEPFRQLLSFVPQRDLRSKVEMALFRRLVGSGILRGQLRICPECERLFLITRKPRSDITFHCSLRCSRNAATKKYRERIAKENGAETRSKERERSHRRYVAKQQEKHPNAKVKRIPRAK